MAELHDVVAKALEASKGLAPALSNNPYRDGAFVTPVVDTWSSRVESIDAFVDELQALCEKYGVSIETAGPQLRLTTPGATANVDLGCGKPSVRSIQRVSPK